MSKRRYSDEIQIGSEEEVHESIDFRFRGYTLIDDIATDQNLETMHYTIGDDYGRFLVGVASCIFKRDLRLNLKIQTMGYSPWPFVRGEDGNTSQVTIQYVVKEALECSCTCFQDDA
ncbi:hypothetical protein Tco_1312581 [Tanacetum coccineum]